MLRAYETVQGTPLPAEARAKAAATPIRLEANRQIELIRSVLFPEDT